MNEKILNCYLKPDMAEISVQSQVNLGYTNLWMLEGGITAWEEAGLSLTKK
jgi:rhodanese-related sulfurtransferase